MKLSENHHQQKNQILIVKKDSVLIYEFPTEKAFKKEIMGEEKAPVDVFI